MQLPFANGCLRSWRLDDAGALVRGANNVNVWRTLRDQMPHPYSLGDAQRYLQKATSQQPELTFGVEVEREFAGGIGLHPGGDVHRLTAELGYWLAEPFWGRGVMTDAVREIVSYGFATLPLVRIEAYVFANNPASRRVLEKAAFTCEGVLRRNVIKQGEMLDSFVYSRLREE